MQLVYEEMTNRGFLETELDRVIAKTGFIQSLNEYPGGNPALSGRKSRG